VKIDSQEVTVCQELRTLWG